MVVQTAATEKSRVDTESSGKAAGMETISGLGNELTRDD